MGKPFMMLTPETQEWLAKAEGDYRVARRELNVTEHPTYDSVCFHVQQCLEKFLKALLSHKQQNIPKTHDLEDLLYRVIEHYPHLKQQFDEAAWEMIAEISGGAVEVRYPGAITTYQDAELFFTMGEQFREYLKKSLEQDK